MRLIIFIYLFILSFTSLFSQKKIELTITDSSSNLPIPYANILNTDGNIGVLTNEVGATSCECIGDTLIISALGYTTDTIYQIDKQRIISLDPTEYSLPVIEVSGKKNVSSMKVGAIKRKGISTSSNCLNANIEIGLLVKNPYYEHFSKLKEVAFFIGKKGVPQNPFRVGIYEFDSKENIPKQNILNSNIVCSPNKGGVWYTVDLSSHNVSPNTEYCVIVFEWLYHDDVNEYKMYKNENGKKCFGQTIGLTTYLTSNLTWTRINGGTWTNSTKRLNVKSKPLNVAINATFERI